MVPFSIFVIWFSIALSFLSRSVLMFSFSLNFVHIRTGFCLIIFVEKVSFALQQGQRKLIFSFLSGIEANVSLQLWSKSYTSHGPGDRAPKLQGQRPQGITTPGQVAKVIKQMYVGNAYYIFLILDFSQNNFSSPVVFSTIRLILIVGDV